MEPHVPDALRPRIEPSPSGVDGPSAMVITGESSAPSISSFFKPAVIQQEEKAAAKRRGKQRATSSDEEVEELPRPKPCLVRDTSKVQSFSRSGPKPIFGAPPEHQRLRDSEGASQGRDSSSSLLASSSGGKDIRHSVGEGPRPGRWVKDMPRKHSGKSRSRADAELRYERRRVPHEFEYIRAGDSDQYGEVPFFFGEEGEEEEACTLIDFVNGFTVIPDVEF